MAHPYFNLIVILILAVILANIIPSGVYDRVSLNGKTVVDPTTFHFVDKTSVGIVALFESLPKGFEAIASLAALMFFIGGAFGVANKIKLIEIALLNFYQKIKHLPFTIFVAVFLFAYGMLISFTGMFDLGIVFIPIVVPLCLIMGYDAMTGVAITLVASCIGYGAAMANPFFTANAHKIAELPIYSGLEFRGMCFLILIIPSTLYILNYAKKVKADPTKSILYGMNLNFKALSENEKSEFTPALIRAAIAFGTMFAFLIYGCIKLNFGFTQMSATFAAMGFLTAFAYGMNLNQACYAFADGMKTMFMAATVTLFARSILYILESAQVIDTIIMFLSQFIEGSTYVSTVMIFFVQSLINFIIPSGSGQAFVTMPMIVPLADMAGIPRQVAHLASQFGDGFSNFIWPTNGSLLAVLAAAGVPFSKWAKFFAPLFFIISAFATIFLCVAVFINLGPF